MQVEWSPVGAIDLLQKGVRYFERTPYPAVERRLRSCRWDRGLDG